MCAHTRLRSPALYAREPLRVLRHVHDVRHHSALQDVAHVEGLLNQKKSDFFAVQAGDLPQRHGQNSLNESSPLWVRSACHGDPVYAHVQTHVYAHALPARCPPPVLQDIAQAEGLQEKKMQFRRDPRWGVSPEVLEIEPTSTRALCMCAVHT